MPVKLAVNVEAFRDHTKLFRAIFKKDPRFLFAISDGGDFEALGWVGQHLSANIRNPSYRGCFLGYMYGLMNSLLTPMDYVDALFPNCMVSILEFKPEMMELDEPPEMIFAGSVRCCICPSGPIGPNVTYDCLSISEKYTSIDDIADLYRGLYIEVARFQKERPKRPIGEIKYDFPIFDWQIGPERLILGNIVEEFSKEKRFSTMETAMLVLGCVVGNDAVEDRFDPDYNPDNLKMMRLLPTDAFTLPQSVIELFKEARVFFSEQAVVSRCVTPSAAMLKELRTKDADDRIHQMLFNRLTVKNRSTLIFFFENEPIALMEYSTGDREPTHLHAFFVKEQYRGRGFGSWILRQYLAEIYLAPDALPLTVLEMFTGGDKSADLLTFYRKHGFHPHGVILSQFISKKEFAKLFAALEE